MDPSGFTGFNAPGMSPTPGVPGFTPGTATNPGYTAFSAPGELGANTGWSAPSAPTGYTTNTSLSGLPGWATDFGDPSLAASTQGFPAAPAAPAVTAQPSADIAGRSPSTIADVVDTMTQRTRIRCSNPTQVTTTQTPQTQTPHTDPADTDPADTDACASPDLTNHLTLARCSGSRLARAAQAVTQAAQAAQDDPGMAAQVAAAAPGLVAAVGQAFRVDQPTAAMMVLQGMRRQEAQGASQVGGLGDAAPSMSSVGFSDLGGGGGGSSSGLNVDTMVGQVLGMSPSDPNLFASRGGAPGFAQGGLVHLAAGGLAKPVLSSSSMNSMGSQSHFGARNVQGAAAPKGANLAAINVPAVRSPGAHLINSSVAGRSDRIPMRARTGSFVIPADVVSGLGEGNTMAGAKMWGQLLTHSVTGAAAAGMRKGAAPALKGGIGRGSVSGPGSRVPPPPKAAIAPPQKVPYQNLPVSSKGLPHGFADGGALWQHAVEPSMDDDTTPIVTAGGEMIVDPEIITALGGGDFKVGTDILCKSIEGVRKQVIAFQKTLGGPSR